MRGPLCLEGKLGRRHGQLNALGGLVYLQDSSSEQRFLVDTGAAVSVFPHRSSAAPSGPPLTGADGRSIPSWGSIKKTLSFGLHTFICSFILAAVSKPILSVDFLAANRLLVDPFSRQVLDSETLLPLTPSVSAPPRHSRFAAALPLHRGSLPCRSRSPQPPFFFSNNCWRRFRDSKSEARHSPLH